jgi:hypothetical protein
MKFKFLVLLFLSLIFTMSWSNGWGQTYFNMSSGNYSQNFADMANWTNNYVAGTGASNWKVATTATGSSVSAGTVFATVTAGGVQKGTQSLIMLATGTNSSATDLLLNLSGRTAGTLSLDWVKVVNTANASPRSSDLKIQYSTDGGSNFTDITGYTIPRILNNSTAESGSLSSITLPAALNNQSTVVLRFYVWNNSQTGGSGNRPKWQLDNISVTSTVATTAPAAPTISSITPGNEQLSVAFTAGSDGGSAITNYKYSTDNGGSYTEVLPAATTSPIVITGLTNGTTYNVKILAVNALGDGAESAASSGTPVAPSSPTLNPVTLASSLSSTYGTASVGVSFTASGSNLTGNITATAQSGYEVSTSLGSGYGASVSVASGTTVYVRFASTISAGDKNNATAVVLSGGGASSNANVSTSASGNTVSKATPTINSSPSATNITYGQTLASSTLSGGSASVAGSFTFTTPSTAPNGGTANQSVTFAPTDNANYNSTTTNVSVTVNQANQTITFGALVNKTTSDGPFSLTATASSGLVVSYSSSNTAVATIVGSTVTIVGAGQTTITASQVGNGNYNAATSVDQPLTVTQAPVNIFTENMGSLAANTAITSHTFQNSSTLTFTNGGATNSADVRNTNASSGYTGASGNGNVFFTTTSGSYGFAIEGIDASTYTNLEVRFAYRKESGSVLPNLTIDYWNGSSYVNVPFSYNEAANAAAGWYLVNWIALPAGAQISTLSLRWVKAGSQSVRLDDISLRGIINTSPLILVSPNSITGFSQNSATPSAEQSYAVSGDNLTNDVTITPPTGFEISTSTGGSFSATNPITLTAAGGNLVGEPVTIYVRQSSSTLGVVSGNITHSSTGSNNPNVAVSGTRTGTYYSKSSGNLEELGTWGINTDGSGSAPSNFSTDGIIYEIKNRATATIGANWTVSGAASKVLVGDGTNSTDFTIPSTFSLTGTIDISNLGELTIENTTAPTIGTVADNGTVEYKNVEITLSTATTYKNLKLSGSGTKTFPGNTTTITGNLFLDNVTLTASSSAPFSTVSLGGNLTYIGTVTPPADASSITLSTSGTAGGSQTITGAGNTLRWFRIQSTTANTILLSTSGGSSNLSLGNNSGGGLTLLDGSVLNMNGNDLTLFNSSSTSSAFLFNNTATISTNSSSDFTIERTGNGNLGTIRFTTGASTIGSLTLNHTGSANKTLYIANELTIANSLTLTSGILNAGVSTLTLNGSLSRTSGNIDASNASATVVFSGSSAQTIPASTFSGSINNLTINNSQGLTTNQNLTVTNVLTLSNGVIDLGASNLNMASNAINGGSASSYVRTSGNGVLKRNVSSSPTLFPVGKSAYNPAILTNSGEADLFSVRVYDYVSATGVEGGIQTSGQAVNRTWMISESLAGESNVTLKMYWNAGEEVNGFVYSPGFMNVMHHNGSIWEELSATSQGDSPYFIEKSGISSFSPFTIGFTGSPLPVEFLEFTAKCNESSETVLNWSTASEHNSDYFKIEKSIDGMNWSILATVAAAGNSTERIDYTLVDNEKSSAAYYKLWQYDVDGSESFLALIHDDCSGNFSDAQPVVYPNPTTNNALTIQFNDDKADLVKVEIYSLQGKLMYSQTFKGAQKITIADLTLDKGIYQMTIQQGGKDATNSKICIQ